MLGFRIAFPLDKNRRYDGVIISMATSKSAPLLSLVARIPDSRLLVDFILVADVLLHKVTFVRRLVRSVLPIMLASYDKDLHRTRRPSLNLE